MSSAAEPLSQQSAPLAFASVSQPCTATYVYTYLPGHPCTCTSNFTISTHARQHQGANQLSRRITYQGRTAARQSSTETRADGAERGCAREGCRDAATARPSCRVVAQPSAAHDHKGPSGQAEFVAIPIAGPAGVSQSGGLNEGSEYILYLQSNQLAIGKEARRLARNKRHRVMRRDHRRTVHRGPGVKLSPSPTRQICYKPSNPTQLAHALHHQHCVLRHRLDSLTQASRLLGGGLLRTCSLTRHRNRSTVPAPATNLV